MDRAIRRSCDQVTIGGDHHHNGGFSWSEFWDPDEGIRTLRLLACGAYPSTYEEDELRRFTVEHWEFFYANAKGDEPRRGCIQILWPKIQEYMRFWREKRESDYWAAGMTMVADLSAAQLKAPTWPRQSTSARAVRRDDLDDEIPF